MIKSCTCALLFILLSFTASTEAGVIINEVLANEPGAQTSLEWIELHNDSTEAVTLDGYRLLYDVYEIVFAASDTIPADGFIVVCDQLYADAQYPGFESYWGDSSGVWGDCDLESYLTQPLERELRLVNTGDTLSLYADNGATLVNQFAWDEDGNDGCSWERRGPAINDVAGSIARDGSSPGDINSWIAVDTDASIDWVHTKFDEGLTEVLVAISNPGNTVVRNLTVALRTTRLGADTLISGIIAELPPDQFDSVVFTVSLPGEYEPLEAVIPDDDRHRNNFYRFKAPGADFATLLISEVMANPQAPLMTEWIELHNVSDDAVDLTNWRWGDDGPDWLISPTPLIVPPGDFVVITDNRTDFQAYYLGFIDLLVSPSSWPTLNNTGDSIALFDPNGIETDRFSYETVFDDNHTWSRQERDGVPDRWGRSETPGGTPGGANDAVIVPEIAPVSLQVIPPVFSPDDDGFQDSTLIQITAPDNASLTLKIYDRHGREVAVLADEDPYPSMSYAWHGRDGSRRLPLGVYIVLLEADGDAVKKPVVIAR